MSFRDRLSLVRASPFIFEWRVERKCLLDTHRDSIAGMASLSPQEAGNSSLNSFLPRSLKKNKQFYKRPYYKQLKPPARKCEVKELSRLRNPALFSQSKILQANRLRMKCLLLVIDWLPTWGHSQRFELQKCIVLGPWDWEFSTQHIGFQIKKPESGHARRWSPHCG